MEKKITTATAKQVMDLMKAVVKISPEAPVYLSSDPEGNSYGTIEPWNNKNFSSFSIQLTDDYKKVKSVVIYPWHEGLSDEDVGLLTQEEIDALKGKDYETEI